MSWRPATGKLPATGISLDPGYFAGCTLENNTASRPHCGGAHQWSKAGAIPVDEPGLN